LAAVKGKIRNGIIVITNANVGETNTQKGATTDNLHMVVQSVRKAIS
jgi:hypothetical protein